MDTIRAATDRILFAVADAIEEDPIEMTPLEHFIDTEALGRVIESGAVEVQFEYEGVAVTVRDVDDIELAPL